MKIESTSLLEELVAKLDKATAIAEGFKELELAELNARKSRDSWSLLECIEHLNRYGYFYLPEIENRILAQSGGKKSGIFKSGLLGNYLVNLIKMDGTKIRKMKTATAMNPIQTLLDEKTIGIFLKQQQRLRSLLEQARNIDLTRTTTKTTLSPFIKLRLGDTLRFMVHHIERHVAQAEATQF